MMFHADLLAQAKHLATKESKRPRQASLRRAISAAYYAVFHLLTSEAALLFAREDKFWQRMNRVYGHTELNDVSKSVALGKLPKVFDGVIGPSQFPPALRSVARTFVDLQQARHDADYDLTKKFTRSDALTLVRQAEQAFKDWQAIRKDDLARIYLGCFLLWKQWDKSR